MSADRIVAVSCFIPRPYRCTSRPEYLPIDKSSLKASNLVPFHLALVSTAVPPSPSGQARVLGALAAHRGNRKITFLTDNRNALANKGDGVAAAAYVALNASEPYRRIAHFPPLYQLLQKWAYRTPVERRARDIIAALTVQRADIILACTANLYDLPASYVAAQRLGIPFGAYLFDDPVLQWPTHERRKFAAEWESVWAKEAALVVAPNEILAEDFEHRTGRNAVIVRNPALPGAYGNNTSERPLGTPLRLLYTGSVYHAQLDAVRNVAEAAARLPGGAVFDIHTSQAAKALGGLDPVIVRVKPHIYSDEIFDVQKSADVLVLPLGFDTGVPEVIRSAAPGKMAEYLASGRPILAHVPADSFVARFFRERECGVLVDTPDIARISCALRDLAGDAALRLRIVRNAQDAAREFTANTASEKFWSAIESAASPSR